MAERIIPAPADNDINQPSTVEECIVASHRAFSERPGSIRTRSIKRFVNDIRTTVEDAQLGPDAMLSNPVCVRELLEQLAKCLKQLETQLDAQDRAVEQSLLAVLKHQENQQ